MAIYYLKWVARVDEEHSPEKHTLELYDEQYLLATGKTLEELLGEQKTREIKFDPKKDKIRTISARTPTQGNPDYVRLPVSDAVIAQFKSAYSR